MPPPTKSNAKEEHKADADHSSTGTMTDSSPIVRPPGPVAPPARNRAEVLARDWQLEDAQKETPAYKLFQRSGWLAHRLYEDQRPSTMTPGNTSLEHAISNLRQGLTTLPNPPFNVAVRDPHLNELRYNVDVSLERLLLSKGYRN